MKNRGFRERVWPHVLGALIVVALPRLWAWPWTDNVYGDAVVRTQLAQAWSQSPHLIRSFSDGALQFGPLHLMIIGVMLKGVFAPWMLTPSDAGRWLSLVAGSLSALPLWFLTEKLFGRRAAWVACAGLAVWGLHIQASTTAASEALGLFFLLCGLSSFVHENGSVRRAAFSGLCFTLACAVRYDAWLMGAWMGMVHAVTVRSWKPTLAFGVVLASFPVLWMLGNWADMGHPLYPIQFVDEYHRTWVVRELDWYRQSFGESGPWVFRATNALFWPGAALLSLSPLLAVLGITGMACSQGRSAWWLSTLVVLPAVYFSVRAAVWMNFVPLARFAMPQLLLLLPFVEPGIRSLATRWNVAARAVAIGVLVFAGVWSLGLSVGTAPGGGGEPWSEALRPLSPTTPESPIIQALSAAVRELPQGCVLLDAAPEYQDIQLSARPLLAGSHWCLARGRGSDLDAEEVPRAIVVFAGGVLGTHPALAWTGDGFSYATRQGRVHFREVSGFPHSKRPVSGIPTQARLFVRDPVAGVANHSTGPVSQ